MAEFANSAIMLLSVINVGIRAEGDGSPAVSHSRQACPYSEDSPVMADRIRLPSPCCAIVRLEGQPVVLSAIRCLSASPGLRGIRWKKPVWLNSVRGTATAATCHSRSSNSPDKPGVDVIVSKP